MSAPDAVNAVSFHRVSKCEEAIKCRKYVVESDSVDLRTYFN